MWDSPADETGEWLSRDKWNQTEGWGLSAAIQLGDSLQLGWSALTLLAGLVCSALSPVTLTECSYSSGLISPTSSSSSSSSSSLSCSAQVLHVYSMSVSYEQLMFQFFDHFTIQLDMSSWCSSHKQTFNNKFKQTHNNNYIYYVIFFIIIYLRWTVLLLLWKLLSSRIPIMLCQLSADHTFSRCTH